VAARIADGGLKVVEALSAAHGKTKSLVAYLSMLGVAPTPTLLVVSRPEEALLRAARNVPWLTVRAPSQVSVYQLLRARQTLFERAALLALQETLAS
jgi:ribosomal protein L4